eukprot:scaffold1249_cov243-Pinguiococcus_pyrenoidosus.AAC.6
MHELVRQRLGSFGRVVLCYDAEDGASHPLDRDVRELPRSPAVHLGGQDRLPRSLHLEKVVQDPPGGLLAQLGRRQSPRLLRCFLIASKEGEHLFALDSPRIPEGLVGKLAEGLRHVHEARDPRQRRWHLVPVHVPCRQRHVSQEAAVVEEQSG